MLIRLYGILYAWYASCLNSLLWLWRASFHTLSSTWQIMLVGDITKWINDTEELLRVSLLNSSHDNAATVNMHMMFKLPTNRKYKPKTAFPKMCSKVIPTYLVATATRIGIYCYYHYKMGYVGARHYTLQHTKIWHLYDKQWQLYSIFCIIVRMPLISCIAIHTIAYDM